MHHILFLMFFFCKQKTAYEMRISDWSSDVCSSDLSRRRMTVPFTTIDKLYINGEWIDSGPEREDVINPATEAVICRAPVGTAAAADAAIAAARTAFDDGPWPTMSMAERAAILRRMHAALDARRADIAALIVAEVGCAQGITHGMQVAAPLDHFLSALDHSTREEPIRLPPDITPAFMNPDAPKKLEIG